MCWLPGALEVMMDDGFVDLSPKVLNSCGLIRSNYNKKESEGHPETLWGGCDPVVYLERNKPRSSKDMT